MRRHPWHDLPWHVPSDQPDQIRFPKRPLRRLALPEYARMAATALTWSPLVAAGWLMPTACRPAQVRDFIGVAVSPDPRHDRALPGLIRDLGVRRLLVRAPVWERDALQRLVAFMARFPGADWLVTVPPNRASVVCPARWCDDLLRIAAAVAPFTRVLQIGHAPNRTKWGCYHLGDALDLLEGAERARRQAPGLRLAGPAVIDFEPLASLRMLCNHRDYRLDVVSALLYVDRRGAPESRQYGVFDLARKIRFTAACAAAGPRAGRGAPLWITEFNWPIAHTGDHTPTSDDECVDEATAADYLVRSYRMAWATGLVERMYWWQLVAVGYGLVDPLHGDLRRRPAYTAMQRLAHGDLAIIQS